MKKEEMKLEVHVFKKSLFSIENISFSFFFLFFKYSNHRNIAMYYGTFINKSFRGRNEHESSVE
jgi:hypothetical protein